MSSATGERPPTGLRDAQHRRFERAPPADHVLGAQARQAGADKLDHLLDRNAVCEQRRFARAILRDCQEF